MELVHKYDLSPIFVCESAGTQAEDSKMMKDYYLSL
jgi:deoxyribonuclease-4